MISAQQTLKLPTIAIDYRADATKPLPALTRVGVDVDQQKPITLREAIVLALSNNKDIEVARDNVQLAEADLLTVRGAYDPRFTAQSYYERIKTPAASFLSGASVAVETTTSRTRPGSKASRRNSAATIASTFLRFGRRPTASSPRSTRVIRPR